MDDIATKGFLDKEAVFPKILKVGARNRVCPRGPSLHLLLNLPY